MVKPGVNGPKPSRYCASVEKLTIDIVRPWKLLRQTMISALIPAGMPFTVSPHLRAALSAVSTASAPEFMSNATSMCVTAWSCSSRKGSWSLRKARDVSVTRFACSVTAARIRGWQCPWLTAEYAARQSRYLRPSTSHTHTPSPRRDDDVERMVVVRAELVFERNQVNGRHGYLRALGPAPP